MPLLIVKLNPAMPTLWTDPANLLQVLLDVVLILPIFRQPLPIVDIHSGQQIGDRQRRATIGHMNHFQPGFAGKQFAQEMIGRADAGGAVIEFSRL